MNNFLQCSDRRILLDKEGYLRDLDDWNEEVAELLAQCCDVRLTDAHWEIISTVRNFYRDYQLSPPMRPLVKAVRQELGEDKGRSLYLMKLFGGSVARTVNRIAGLPRPANCI